MKYQKVSNTHIFSTTLFGSLIHVGSSSLKGALKGFLLAIPIHIRMTWFK